jgi:hypothetical protein
LRSIISLFFNVDAVWNEVEKIMEARVN